MNDIVLSTRVRLARNIKGKPFVNNSSLAMQKELEQSVIKKISQSGEYSVMTMDSISELERQMLFQSHQISRELAANTQSGAVCLKKDSRVSVMINEEDHIRIQAISDGFSLEESLEQAVQAAQELQQMGLEFARDANLGYLTCCPTNLGTGMRASAMVHLPAIALTKRMQTVAENMSKLGITIRGMFGEGSEAKGDIYQISNRITLGNTRNEIVRLVKETCEQLIKSETEIREALKNNSYIADRICRAYGVLTNARLLSRDEFMSLFSDIKLGIGMGLIRVSDETDLDGLIVDVQPAVISRKEGKELTQAQRDEIRAALVAQRIRQAQIQ
ncbi:MAG: ATP--guanido phosphotransferase [Christensenellaceae bacterium]|jgi:putative ATP:guanido phosphotransferase TTE2328|nr:ATP--guanido phosphotransferase [Christensenellaceae bacterium]MBS6565156.1 ATP--guanido phosphotransferase [Clostridiales bacterium]